MANIYLTREEALEGATSETIKEVEEIEKHIASLKNTRNWKKNFVAKFGGIFGYSGFAKASSRSIHFVKYGRYQNPIYLHVGCANINGAGAGWMMRITK